MATKDEEKKGFAYEGVGFSGLKREVANTPEVKALKKSGVVDKLKAGDFSTPQAAGATINASARQAVNLVNRGANAAFDVATAPQKAVADALQDPSVRGFAAGLVTGDPGSNATDGPKSSGFAGVPARASQPNTADPGKNYVAAARNDLAPAPGAVSPGAVATPNRMPDRAPVNDDQVAANFLATESADRNPGKLDVNNMQPVQGLKDVNYAGRYGKTDVFGNVTTDAQGNKVGRFSDRANLATLAGGKAATVPEGKTAVTNESLNGINFSGDQDGDGLPDQTSQALVDARRAAMARGDFEAVERSMMTSEQRAEADAAKGFRDVQARARRDDPVNAYAQDLGRMSAQEQNFGSMLGAQATAERNARIDSRNDSKAQGTMIKQAFDMGVAQLPPDPITGKPDPAAVSLYQNSLAAIAKKFPNASPLEWASLAAQAMNGEVDASDPESDPDAASVINSFL